MRESAKLDELAAERRRNRLPIVVEKLGGHQALKLAAFGRARERSNFSNDLAVYYTETRIEALMEPFVTLRV